MKIDTFSRGTRLLIYMFLFVAAVVVEGNYCLGQSSELTSPNGAYTVRILKRALATADRIMGDSTLTISKDRHVLLEVPTTGYLIDALWSPDGRYVAINNRRGNSGDYVWVFSLRDGRMLKKPDDQVFSYPLQKITAICEDCIEASFDKDLMLAKAWTSPNELEVETRWRFYKTALIIRHAVYKVLDRKVMLVSERLDRHPVDWQSPEK